MENIKIEESFESKVLDYLSSIIYVINPSYSEYNCPDPDLSSAFNYLDRIIMLMVEDRKELIQRIAKLEENK